MSATGSANLALGRLRLWEPSSSRFIDKLLNVIRAARLLVCYSRRFSCFLACLSFRRCSLRSTTLLVTRCDLRDLSTVCDLDGTDTLTVLRFSRPSIWLSFSAYPLFLSNSPFAAFLSVFCLAGVTLFNMLLPMAHAKLRIREF